jgi:hypothetical protein
LLTKYGVEAYCENFPYEVADKKPETVGFDADADRLETLFPDEKACPVKMIFVGKNT